MIKKVFLVVICSSFLGLSAYAQLGGLLQKAVQKTVQKTTDKMVDKATDKASDAAVKAMEDEFSKNRTTQSKTASVAEAPAVAAVDNETFAGLMAQIPDLPTAQQLVNYKSAELNEQALKLMTSPVMSFNTKIMSLSMQALSLSTKNLDSAQVTDAAYNQVEAATGLSREEIDKLSTMSEAEQQAYLSAHYAEGRAEAALVQQSAEAVEYLKPVQPLIDEWSAVDTKIEKIYAEADEQCKPIYGKYADKLSKTVDKEHNNVLVKYYSEIVALRRSAVQQALQLRLKEQLPIADKIEEQMLKIRAEHPDLISSLLNYPQLTATQYFSEPTKLMDIPEY